MARIVKATYCSCSSGVSSPDDAWRSLDVALKLRMDGLGTMIGGTVAHFYGWRVAMFVIGLPGDTVQLAGGQVILNGAGLDFTAPFGGYKQSGNGREYGEFGLEDFLEIKGVVGYAS